MLCSSYRIDPVGCAVSLGTRWGYWRTGEGDAAVLSQKVLESSSDCLLIVQSTRSIWSGFVCFLHRALRTPDCKSMHIQLCADHKSKSSTTESSNRWLQLGKKHLCHFQAFACLALWGAEISPETIENFKIKYEIWQMVYFIFHRLHRWTFYLPRCGGRWAGVLAEGNWRLIDFAHLSCCSLPLICCRKAVLGLCSLHSGIQLWRLEAVSVQMF